MSILIDILKNFRYNGNKKAPSVLEGVTFIGFYFLGLRSGRSSLLILLL
nr:MAG TPA: hypothetical protein [Caudoviricetes sp.]